MALPLILANVTTPLLGLVDTAILGRMDEVAYFAGASIGAMIITQLYWICGFMKMSVTGLSAQAKGQTKLSTENASDCPNNPNGKSDFSLLPTKVLIQGSYLALLIAIVLLIFNPFILEAGLFFSQAEPEVARSIGDYFNVRIWGAPAALINMVLVGWLIGQQETKLVLYLQVFINLVNIVASLFLVYVLNLGVEGVASATVFAEFLLMLTAYFYAFKVIKKNSVGLSNQTNSQLRQIKDNVRTWISFPSLMSMLQLNSHMLIRNLALQFTLAFITLKGAQFGAQTAAINAIILQFFSLIALGLDGIANAVEAMVGEKKGQKDATSLRNQVFVGLLWSTCFALLYCLLFYIFGEQITQALTDHEDVIIAMRNYQWLIILLPIIAHWCFLYDGVFVGLSQGKPMRDSMLFSTVCIFIPTWWITSEAGNEALWLAMLAFLASRGIVLGAYFHFQSNRAPSKLLG